MLLRSLRARRRRTQLLVTVMATLTLAAMAACGIDAVATKEFPEPPDASETGPVVLPPKPDGAIEDGGVDAVADAPLGCPATHGAMVLVDAGGLFFCIDSTEVRNDAYDEFLKGTDGGNPAALDGGAADGCAGNTTFARAGAVPDAASLPVAQIDWCDAHAFCAWAGKRMCGKQVANDASTGEWFAACTNGGTKTFPYGNDYDASACNDNNSSATKPVGTPTCQGGVNGLFDMNGNVTELVDNCTGAFCSGMGGYFFAPAVPASGCATAKDYAKSDTDPGIGFRCCADPR